MSYQTVIDGLPVAEEWKGSDSSTTVLATTATPANDLDPNGSGHTYGLASQLTSGTGGSVKRGSGAAAGFFVASGATSITDPANVFAVSGRFNQEGDWPVTEGYFFYRNKAAAVNYCVSAVRVSATTAKLKAYWDDGSATGPVSSISNSAVLTSNTDHQIVAIFTGVEILLYVDGAKVAFTAGTDALASTTLDRMAAGMSGTGGNELASLRMSQIKLYSAPLTTLDVESLWAEAQQADTAVTNVAALNGFKTRIRANADPTPVVVCGNSNANYANSPSGASINYGTIGGWYHALNRLGYKHHGTAPMMLAREPGGIASEVRLQQDPIPWTVEYNNGYGVDTGAPLGADAFWDINGSSSLGGTARDFMMPGRYKWITTADAINTTLGRVFGGVVVKAASPINGHDLRATFWYVEGPYTTAGKFQPAAYQSGDVKTGSSVSVTGATYAVKSVVFDIGAADYTAGTDLHVHWGTNATGSLQGEACLLGLRVESRDNAGGFEVAPLIHGSGMHAENASNALVNMSDAGLTWYFQALTANQTTPFMLIDWVWGINSEGLTHQAVIDATVNGITRIRAIAASATGMTTANSPAILRNDHPVQKTGNAVEEAYVKEVHRDMLSAATTLTNCTTVAAHAVNDYDAYVANSWSDTALNHHLTRPTGYDGEADALLAAMGFTIGGRSSLAIGLGVSL